MPQDKSIPEPWISFLRELDSAVKEVVRLDCMGGFVVTTVYGFSRATGDLDVFEIAPGEAGKPMLELGMQGGPDVLTPEEIMAFLKELPDPLRTMIELDAFTGLRRGELIGLRWQDVDFENLVLHIRRSVVAMVEGAPKTEASLKDVPLDAQTAESLWVWKQSCPYPGPGDWIFASPHMKGRQPYWPGTLWRYYGMPALQRAKVTKRVSFHTFRHTFGTLLNANGENPKVVQELLRHASLKVTTDIYMQAVGSQKREAQNNLVKLIRKGAVLEVKPA